MPSGGGTSTTRSVQELSPEQQKLIGMVMPVAENYLKTPLKLYPESTVAGIDPLQKAARKDIIQTATGPVNQFTDNALKTGGSLSTQGAAQGLGGNIPLIQSGGMGAQGLGSVLDDYSRTGGSRDFLASGALMDPRTNPVLRAQTEAAIRPLGESLTRRILPGIRSDFVGGNMFGSSRQGIAEGMAMDSFIKEAGDISTNLQANNFNQGLGAMLSTVGKATDAASAGVGQGLDAGARGTGNALDAALGALSSSPALAQLAFLPGMTMEGVGESWRQLNQAQLSEKANKYMTKQMLPFMQAQDVANLAFGIGGGTSTTTGQQQGAFDPVGTAGGLGMLAMLFGLL